MKLSKDAIRSVLNHIIDNQKFDFNEGAMQKMDLTEIVKSLSDGSDDKDQEIACAIIRCINEGFVYSNYPKAVWVAASISDITLRGFMWLENNNN